MEGCRWESQNLQLKEVRCLMKKNKAPGPGGIPIELLKYGGKNVIFFLTDMFNEIF